MIRGRTREPCADWSTRAHEGRRAGGSSLGGRSLRDSQASRAAGVQRRRGVDARIGIGATTSIVSVVYAVLLKPLPYPEAERLVGVYQRAPRLNLPVVDQGCCHLFHVSRPQPRVQGHRRMGLHRGHPRRAA